MEEYGEGAPPVKKLRDVEKLIGAADKLSRESGAAAGRARFQKCVQVVNDFEISLGAQAIQARYEYHGPGTQRRDYARQQENIARARRSGLTNGASVDTQLNVQQPLQNPELGQEAGAHYV